MAAKTEEELLKRLTEGSPSSSPYKKFYVTSKLSLTLSCFVKFIFVDFMDIPGNDYCVMQHSNK